MRYFSTVLKDKIPYIFNVGKRSVSFRTRTNLLNSLSSIEKNMDENPKDSKVEFKECQKFEINFVGNGAYLGKSVIVTSSAMYYLFNCGEGMQRICMDHGIKINKIKTLFITHPGWCNIGGIMSLCLTLKLSHVTKLVIFGPPEIKDIVLGLRYFVVLKNLALEFVAVENFTYEDSSIKVQVIPIHSKASSNVIKYKVDSTEETSDAESDSDSESPKRKKLHLNNEVKNSNSYYFCYICETPYSISHLDIKKCMEMGVPMGKQLSTLKEHKDITLDNGKVVHWRDVIDSVGETNIFIFVDCPSEEYLDSLVNEREMAKYQDKPEKEATLIIHFTEPEIMENEKYVEWMGRFPKGTIHVKVNRSNPFVDHMSLYRIQEKLHLIHPEIFPMLSEYNLPQVVKQSIHKFVNSRKYFFYSGFETNIQPKTLIFKHEDHLDMTFNEKENQNGVDMISAYSSLRFIMIPKTFTSFSHSIFLNRMDCLMEVTNAKGFNEEFERFSKWRTEWENSEECKSLPEYPKIWFLGTGSSFPSPMRNPSGILLELENGTYLLFDCAEGTYGQIRRLFGRDKMRDVFKNLRMIYVTHQHGDHHLGIISLLQARQEILSTMDRSEYMSDESEDNHLLLMLPPSVRVWVNFINSHMPILKDTRIFTTKNVKTGGDGGFKKLIYKMGINELKTALMPHTFESFAVSMVFANNFRFTYSGDTMPSSNLVKLGLGSDLLIHEATFEDGLEDMAKQKRHSTISQAIEIGKRMGARQILLTHFSQRYSHLPLLEFNPPDNVGIAFDNMMLSPKTIPLIPKMMNCFKIVFADKLMTLHNKLMKRNCKDYEGKESEKIAAV